ncbi:MAG: tRNA pseudouridine(55) synthase TruB [Candidatus Omnitrophota bacterium]
MENIIIIDKPAGLTSHDVVDLVRKRLGIKKVGHCGTLDPIATGVLVILLNGACKLSSKLITDEKEYICTATIGISTDSQDATGRITSSSNIEHIDTASIKKTFLSFMGEQEQIAPMLSAKHHKGKRLYELARKGIEVERKPHAIDIKDIEVLSIKKPDVEFKVVCSKGTYIRTLCHDAGRKLGCGGHMSALRRIRSGSFHIRDAVKLEEVSV